MKNTQISRNKSKKHVQGTENYKVLLKLVKEDLS